MPAVPAALSTLIKTEVDGNLNGVTGYSPLGSSNPSYFIEFCTAIGTGIALGSPVISFTTVDAGQAGTPPIPGVGAGVGIVVDEAFLTEKIYTYCRTGFLAEYGKTGNIAYPPTDKSNGKVLEAIAKGIAKGVKTHYASAWILTSAHPIVYAGSGSINNGMFSGLVDATVKTQIKTAAPRMVPSKGWDIMSEAIAKAYVEAIHTKSTGTVAITGVCVPSPGQICGLPIPGAGSGVAA